jgi:ribosome biogenesis protein ERB1
MKKSENPNWWRMVKDELNQKNIEITDEQLDIMRRIRTGKFVNKAMADTNYDIPLDKKEFIHPMDNTIPPKRRFMPSKWERMKVNKILHAIEMGWIKLDEEEEEKPKEDELFDLWGDEFNEPLYKNLPPPLILPKTKRPTNRESYNPDSKLLMSAEQEAEWKQSHTEDREIEYIPKKYDCLRKVEAYENMLRERFERCLDLYLAPRVKKRKVHMNPDDLLPELPPPSSLKPFPSFPNVYYRGHESRVRSIRVNLQGTHLFSGDEQGNVFMFDVKTSRILKKWKFEDTVYGIDVSINGFLAVGEGPRLHIINPLISSENVISEMDYLIDEAKTGHGTETEHAVDWKFTEKDSDDYLVEGIRVSMTFATNISQVVFHKKGDYIATLTPSPANKDQVFIHSIKKGKSQRPFVKAKADIQKVLFHSQKPIVFIATKQTVWLFNLQTQTMVKKLISGVKWYSCMELHPEGDNLITGSYDRKLNWFDLDLGDKPYQTLRFHKKAIRAVAFHKNYPLFASCSDDGGINIFHGMVYQDLMKNALIVPVKVLKGHKIVDDLGVLDICFHPIQPWIFSAGADHSVILWS